MENKQIALDFLNSLSEKEKKELVLELENKDYHKLTYYLKQKEIQKLENKFFGIEEIEKEVEEEIKLEEKEEVFEEVHIEEYIIEEHEEQLEEEIKEENNEVKEKKKFRFPVIQLLLFLVMFYAVGYFIFAYFINVNKTDYVIVYNSTTVDSMNLDKDFFENGKYLIDENGDYILNKKGEKKVSLSAFFKKVDDMLAKNDASKENGKIIIKAKYFISGGSETVNKKSYDNFVLVMNNIIKTYDKNATNINIEANNYYSPWLYSLYFLILGFVFDIIYLILINKNQKEKDREGLFKSVFSKGYWKDSFKRFGKLKVFDITLLALLLALILACKFIPIPSGFAGLGLGLTYLFLALACMIYGPVWALLIGAYSDVLGFIISPTVFLIEYTLQAMVTCFIYGIFFYKKKFSFSRCLIVRIIINIFVNGVWGSYLYIYRYSTIAQELKYDAFKDYMLYISLPKNIIYLIPQTILLFVVLRSLVPLLKRKNIVPKTM